jgi:hypothetical protein
MGTLLVWVAGAKGPQMNARLLPIFNSIAKVAWVLFLVALPVTSFPYFPPTFGGGTLVRPLSVYPLLVLLILATIPRLLTRPLPKATLSLLPFALIAVASSVISLLRNIEPALGISVIERVARAMITLGVGGAIYLTIVLWPRSVSDLKAALRWIYAGMGIAMFVGSLQTIYIIHFTPAWFALMNNLQKYVSTRRLINNRISGLTYEPNWFAEQISFMLLPWLLSSVLNGYSVFKWRWHKLTIEWILLLWSIALLPFTFSRAGVLNLVGLAFAGLIFFRYRPASLTAAQPDPARTKRKRWIRRLLEGSLAIALIFGAIFVVGTRNEFFSRLWSYWLTKSNPTLSGYVKYLGFGARFIYSETAYNTYNAFPVLGVGLGNYAFFFEEMLPDRPINLTPEVLRLITPEEGRNRLITAKNFYLRLLAETGLVGTAAFFAFLAAVGGCALYLWLSPDRAPSFWGTAGLLGMLAFAISAFSFDSLALPNLWVILGLTTAAATIYQNQDLANSLSSIKEQ